MADADATIVSISRGQPRWPLPFSYRRYDALAPNDATWALEDASEFEAAYREQIAAIGADRILSELGRIGGGRPVVCLCWERDVSDPATPCHRRYLSEFMEEEAGLVIPELRPGDLPQREDVPQRSLF